jgi:carbon storage regulator
MLVLTRFSRESIVIGGNITVTVVGVRDGKVRLGINAPREVSVHRKEIQDAIDNILAERAAHVGSMDAAGHRNDSAP